MTVLSLIPATRVVTGSLKATLQAVFEATGSAVLTIALRDNGPKVNGTLVAIQGLVGNDGDAFSARRADTKMPYGPHLILGTITANGDVEGDLDVTLETKLPLFTVDCDLTAGVEPMAAESVSIATVSVKRAKDGEIVATGVTLADAEAMIAKAKSAKKAALVVA